MTDLKKAVWAGVKLVARMLVLYGLPATIAAVIDINPQWAIAVGTILAFVDKVVHKLPNEWKGLLPF